MVKSKKQKVRSWKPKIIEAILKRDRPRQELIKHIGANTVGAIAKSLKELIEEEIILEIECSFDKPHCTECIEFKKNRKIGKFKHKKRGIRAKCLKFNAKVETIKKISKAYPRIFEENLENLIESEELIKDLWKHIKKDFMPKIDPTLLKSAGKLVPIEEVFEELNKRRLKGRTTTRTARRHEPSPAVKKILSFIEKILKLMHPPSYFFAQTSFHRCLNLPNHFSSCLQLTVQSRLSILTIFSTCMLPLRASQKDGSMK